MNLNEDRHYHRRETRIDWLVGQIAKSAYSWKNTVAQVRRDADQVVKDLPCDFAEEQLAEMRDRYRNAEKEPAKLGFGEIAKEIQIERERLAKEAKAAKKPKKVSTAELGIEARFSVNGSELRTAQYWLTVAEILKMASEISAETSVDPLLLEKYTLTRIGGNNDGWNYSDLDRPVRIRDEDKFIAEIPRQKPEKVKAKAEKKPKGMEQWEWIDRIRHYEVNGVKLKTRTDHLTVKRILTQASMFSDTCVDADLLTEYDLTRVGGKKDGFTYSNLDREIRVRDGDKFIAIYHGKTPVA